MDRTSADLNIAIQILIAVMVFVMINFPRDISALVIVKEFLSDQNCAGECIMIRVQQAISEQIIAHAHLIRHGCVMDNIIHNAQLGQFHPTMIALVLGLRPKFQQ
jgi:hypothetical protein